MDSNKAILTIATREFKEVISKPTFWISTLIFPILMGVLIFLINLSTNQADALSQNIVSEEKPIVVVDKLGILSQSFLPPGVSISENKETALNEVIIGTKEALIYYPQELASENGSTIQIYSRYQSPFQVQRFDDFAKELLKQSTLASLADLQSKVLSSNFEVQNTTYKDGSVFNFEATSLVAPGIAILAYFVFIMFGNSFMLSSVSEEKESRMIEIILTSASHKDLILGKLIGLSAVVVTQILLLLVMGLLVLLGFYRGEVFSFISQIKFDPIEMLFGLFIAMLSSLVLANAMVGVGAAVPTLREAQGFSSIFIILSVIPLYFVSIVLVAPSSPFSIAMSYVPILGPFVLLIRNALVELTFIEVFIAIISLVIQVVISFWIAKTMLVRGALNYSSRINLMFWQPTRS